MVLSSSGPTGHQGSDGFQMLLQKIERRERVGPMYKGARDRVVENGPLIPIDRSFIGQFGQTTGSHQIATPKDLWGG